MGEKSIEIGELREVLVMVVVDLGERAKGESFVRLVRFGYVRTGGGYWA